MTQNMNFGAVATDLGQRHMNAIAEAEQRKQTIIHNAQLYVNICNQICAGLDQTIEQHKAAIASLAHQTHGTRVPVQQPPQPQTQPAPQQQGGFSPGTVAQAAAKASPRQAAKPAPAPAPAPEPEHVAEVVHTPPPAPNGSQS